MTGLFTEAGHWLLQPQPAAAGPHDPQLAAGGAIAAAAVTLCEPSRLPGWRLARLTADFLRPAPMITLRFQRRTVRRGRRAVVEEVSVGRVPAREGDSQVAAISLLWLATASEAGAAAARWPDPVAFPEPDRLSPIAAWNDGLFGGAVECRADAGIEGIGAGWCLARLRQPVIEDRQPSPAAAAVAVADIAHGVGGLISSWPPPVAFVNPDLTVSLARTPEPGWLHLAVDETWPGDGTGLAVTRLADRAGLAGLVIQAQTLTSLA